MQTLTWTNKIQPLAYYINGCKIANQNYTIQASVLQLRRNKLFLLRVCVSYDLSSLTQPFTQRATLTHFSLKIRDLWEKWHRS